MWDKFFFKICVFPVNLGAISSEGFIKVTAKYISPFIGCILISCDPNYDLNLAENQLSEISNKMFGIEAFDILENIAKNYPIELRNLISKY